ncbi:hypothetical protein [Photobacterium swingsii]|uniref:hypothetical protein n=1 Tax=Photobacterium swingsii TaxID=680026 RepID=UPI00069E15D6|nr:hypothetical protein [Photobacterium swingsii]
MPNRQTRNIPAKPLRLNRVMVGIALSCSIMATTAFSSVVNALTLSDAWVAAKANEPQYLKSQIDVQIGEADVDSSRAAYCQTFLRVQVQTGVTLTVMRSQASMGSD